MKKVATIAALVLALVPVALAGLAGYSFTPIALLDNPAPGGGNFTFDFEPSAGFGDSSRRLCALANPHPVAAFSVPLSSAASA